MAAQARTMPPSVPHEAAAGFSDLNTINAIITPVFDAVYGPLVRIHPGFALFVISAVLGVLALIVVRYCSNQAAIGRVKDAIKADLLAIKLFKDEIRVMFRAMPRILWSTVKLQLLLLPPILVMIIPIALACGQMAAWHEWRPLRVGERAVLTVRVEQPADAAEPAIAEDPTGPVQRSHALWAVVPQEKSWYVSAERPGRYTLELLTAGGRVEKELVVSDNLDRVSPNRHDGYWVDALLYPRERPLEAGQSVRAITLRMPALDSWFYGSGMWIVWFLILSIAVALVFKPILKVKF